MRTVLAAWAAAVATMVAVAVPAPGANAERQPRDLAAEAVRLAEMHRGKFGPGYVTHIDQRRHLVYVSALDEKTFRKVRQMLGRYADAQREVLFPQPLLWNVSVVLPTLRDYRAGRPPGEAVGYYAPATRTLTSISVSDVLIHEFTHALHHSDQVRANQRHPVWMTEGFATLFQGSWAGDGKIDVRLGPSLATLQGAVREGNLPPLADLLAMDGRAFRRKAEVCYPYVRHLMLYLYRQGKLGRFYERYKSDYASDPTGREALEKVLGRPLAKIEPEWRRWVTDLKLPWTPAHPAVAHLGVRMRSAEGGILVDGFLRGSTAEQAGALRVGDVIVSVAGHATPTPRDLAPAVRACRPGETVEIEIVRDGKRRVVKQVLGAVRK